jgi:large subunit ribosomal protein L19
LAKSLQNGDVAQWWSKRLIHARLEVRILPSPLMNKIEQFNQKNLIKTPIEIQPGWTVKVFQKIKEGGKERVATFEGVIIAKKHGKETGGTFTVRRVVSGVGVEKIFPIYSPTIEKVEILKKAKVRRAKLYYLRGKSRKETRRKLKVI